MVFFILTYYVFKNTACDIPPIIVNGRHNGSTTDRPIAGLIFEYECDENYIPIGTNADQLQTECLSNGSYSTTDLATCARIG